MGNSYFSHTIFSLKMQLIYNEMQTNTKHHILWMRNCTVGSIQLNMLQDSYRATLKITDTQIHHIIYKRTTDRNDSFIYVEELEANEILLINCHFINIGYGEQLFIFNSTKNGSVKFINCQFVNNNNPYSLMYTKTNNMMQLESHRLVKPSLIKLYLNIRVEIINCYFNAYSDNDIQAMQAHGSSANPTTVVIKNTTFSYYTNNTFPYLPHDDTLDLSFIYLSNSILLLEDTAVFNSITNPNSIISLKGNSTIIISGSVEFSHNHAHDLICFYNNDRKYILMKEYSVINITSNDVQLLFLTNPTVTKYPYQYCLFQYFSNYTSTVTMKKRNFSYTFYNNLCKKSLKSGCYDYIPLAHCIWLPQSLFNNAPPLEVNDKYMQFIDNSNIYSLSQIIAQPSLCVCCTKSHYNCHIFDLGYLYPGQTLNIGLYPHKPSTSNAVVVKTDIAQQYVTPCIVLNINENVQVIDKHCTNLHYTIGFSTENQCELFLKIASDSDLHLNIFSVKQLTCPIGFLKIDTRCQCDPVLVQYEITNCNINDQTILRSASNWISAVTHNNSYTYHISLHCPFHYCLPHS